MASVNKRRKAAGAAQVAESALNAAVQKSFSDSCSALLQQSASHQVAADPVVCLVAPSSFGHPVVKTLSAAPQFRVREANVEHVSFLLPAKKTAFLLLGRGGSESEGADECDAVMLDMLLRKSHFASAKLQLRQASDSFATVLVLVLGDADLFKLLTIDSIGHPSATVHYCQTVADAVSLVLHRARLEDLGARQAAAAAALRGLSAHSALQHRIARAIPCAPPGGNLLPDECWQLLSGRASLDICTEHYGWTRETAQAVLQALSTDSKKEN